jgi:class 3 adenylate cyclase/tetratricopeptide (TPR) repeat protein
MEQPAAYIPMDRRQALARGVPLPDRMTGAALFADISGFTPLTEALARELGPKRGAEELTGHLNRVYDALITELHLYGGSVISFAGDAIACWLDKDDGRRATACALAMQQAMSQFAEVPIPSGTTVSLAVKTAVATGPVRRFVVGDPNIQLIDVLAGDTLERLSIAGHLAGKGEVVLTPETAEAIQPHITISEWRPDPQSGERFAWVTGLQTTEPGEPWPPTPDTLTDAQIQPWLLPYVNDQLRYGRGEFLAELRPATALFVQFTGLDYDHDPQAADKLDAFAQEVQRIIARYDGALLQLTIGDKGNYLYAAFGAPVAHEDDAARAVAVAWEIRILAATMVDIHDLRFGIAHGRMRTGAYGSTTRRTYGVLGDSVNLSARLMEAARPGQILATLEIQQAAADSFHWEILPAIQVKGKVDSIALAAVQSPRQRSMLRLLEPSYALPMVGREAELALVAQKLERVLAGQGQIVGITAHPGMGKSRLVAEVIHLANERGLAGYGGECQAYANKSSYHVWQTIWRGFFNVSADASPAEYIPQLEAELARIDPALLPRLPLLSAVLNLPIPDNDLTRSFDAKLRKTSLESLLVACLRARAGERRPEGGVGPLFFVLEDSHWIDPLSHDLLEIIGRAMVDLPILLVLAYRIVEVGGDLPPRVINLPYFTEIMLTEFTAQEAENLMQLKLAQLFGPNTAVPPAFSQKITDRAEGNPFYIEELLNYLQDRQINPQETAALETLDLPDSLHSLILSRVDRLTEWQKSTLKIASVIGRLFRAAMLWGAYPELGDVGEVRSALDVLHEMELTALDSPEPELTYIFKHVVTQEVTYESLPYATRARLHSQIGEYIERVYADSLKPYIPILAHHFDHSQDAERKRRYLLLAAAEAHEKYAHQAAIAYYEKALPLVPEAEKVAVLLKLGEALQPVGRWPEAESVLEEALTLARQLGDVHGRASCQLALADLLRKQGQYEDASARLMRARLNFEELGDEAGVGQVLHSAGTLVAQRGDYERARTLYEESLEIRRRLGDEPAIGSLLSNMGIIARYLGDYETAKTLYEESLSIRQQSGDKWAIAVSLNNLGLLMLRLGDLNNARRRLEEAVALQREVGDRSYLANSLNNLANVARDQEDYLRAYDLYHESLLINRELGDKRAIAYLLEDVSCLAAAEGRAEPALQLFAAAAALRHEMGAPLPPADQEKLETTLTAACTNLSETRKQQAKEQGEKMTWEEAVGFALRL